MGHPWRPSGQSLARGAVPGLPGPRAPSPPPPLPAPTTTSKCLQDLPGPRRHRAPAAPRCSRCPACARTRGPRAASHRSSTRTGRRSPQLMARVGTEKLPLGLQAVPPLHTVPCTLRTALRDGARVSPPRRWPGRKAAFLWHPTRCFCAFHLYVLPRPVLRLSWALLSPSQRALPTSSVLRLAETALCFSLLTAGAGARPGGPRASSPLCGLRGPRSGVPAGADASTLRETRWICGDPRAAADKARTQGPPRLALSVCTCGPKGLPGFHAGPHGQVRGSLGAHGGTPIPSPCRRSGPHGLQPQDPCRA